MAMLARWLFGGIGKRRDQELGVELRSLNGETPVVPTLDGESTRWGPWWAVRVLQEIDRDSMQGTVAFAVNEVLIDHGVAGLSLRRIGKYAGMSPSTMMHHFRNRERILPVAGIVTAKARLATVTWGMLGARAWAGWLEIWRTAPRIEYVIGRARDDELAALARALDHQLTRPALESLYALADGLLVALSAPQRPMSPRTAEALVEAHARHLLRQSPKAVSRAELLHLLRGRRAPAAA